MTLYKNYYVQFAKFSHTHTHTHAHTQKMIAKQAHQDSPAVFQEQVCHEELTWAAHVHLQ